MVGYNGAGAHIFYINAGSTFICLFEKHTLLHYYTSILHSADALMCAHMLFRELFSSALVPKAKSCQRPPTLIPPAQR